jgi:multiple sugar transport system ATP-binding protein
LAASSNAALTAEIVSTEVLGAETVIHARTPGGDPLTATMRGILGTSAGETVRFDVPDAFAHVFDSNGKTLQPKRAWTDDYLKQIA